jgi:hypothetical protein
MARSVAKFTVAVTPPTALSFFSTRAAHAAHVIPAIENSSSRGADDASPVTAADDTYVVLSSHANLVMPGNLHGESKAEFNVAKM